MFRNLFFPVKKVEEKPPPQSNKSYIEYVVQKEFENSECIICLEEMKKNEIVIILRCGHSYHKKCLFEWFKKKKICPLCDI